MTFGRLEVLDGIAQGYMGIAHACHEDQLTRKVAIKVLLGKTFQDVDVAWARLLREAQAMVRLSHIVTMLEASTVDDQMYVAMEFIEGVSHDAWVAAALHGKAVATRAALLWRAGPPSAAPISGAASFFGRCQDDKRPP